MITVLEQLVNIGWNQASMKAKVGWLGLTEVESLSSTAFAAAWSHSVNVLSSRFQWLKVSVNNLHYPDIGDKLLGQALKRSFSSLPVWSSLSRLWMLLPVWYSSEGMTAERHTLWELSSTLSSCS